MRALPPPEVEIDPELLLPDEPSLVELDPSFLSAEVTGSFTCPFLSYPGPSGGRGVERASFALPPPPQLPALGLPPLPAIPDSARLLRSPLPPAPHLPSAPAPLNPYGSSLPMAALGALPPAPSLPRGLPTQPPARPAWFDTSARKHEQPRNNEAAPTRPDIGAPRFGAHASSSARTRRAPRPLPHFALRHFEPASAREPEAHSVRPTSWSTPPPPPRVRRPAARAAGAGIALGAVLFTCAWLFASPSSASAGAQGLVTVTDSKGLALRTVQVSVDGLLRCDTTPCSVDLEPGSHQLDVRNLVTDQRSARSFSVAKGERASLHFALAAEEPALRAARTPEPALAPPPRPDEPIAVTALPLETPESTPEPSPLPPSPVAYQPKPAAGALLTFNSIPISNVILDGRPLGSTPLVNVSVSPGNHNVTFIHPELGRRSATINAGFGQRKAVVVRFAPRDRADEE